MPVPSSAHLPKGVRVVAVEEVDMVHLLLNKAVATELLLLNKTVATELLLLNKTVATELQLLNKTLATELLLLKQTVVMEHPNRNLAMEEAVEDLDFLTLVEYLERRLIF